MFNAALTFIPLLAGYIFVSTWYQTRYLIKREDTQKLYFRAAFWGLWLFLLAFGLISSVREQLAPVISFLHAWGDQSVLTDGKASRVDVMFWVIVLTTTLGFGTLGGYLLNWVFAIKALTFKEFVRRAIRRIKGRDTKFLAGIYDYSKRDAIKHAIHALNSDMDLVLLRAMEKNMPISVTLSHGKVYVGYVTGAIEPGEKREMLRILPFVSGYRAGEEMKLKFTTWYTSVYQKFAKDESLSHLNPELFEIVFPLSEIKSINLFDIDAYQAFQKDD
jgi:hypothetical protein